MTEVKMARIPASNTDIFDDDLSDAEEEDLEKTYEAERLENIQKNAALLASLGLNSTSSIRPRAAPEKKPALSSAEERTRREARLKAAALKRQIEPTRRSSRVAAKEKDGPVDYRATSLPPSPPVRRNPLPKQSAPILASGPEYEAGPSSRAPRPKRKADGTLVFEGRWKGVFTPNLTPQEMFDGGAFAGAFFCDTWSQVLKTPLSSAPDIDALPFDPKDPERLYTNTDPDGDLNRFRVRAGQSLQEWEKAGWIWSVDPRGWAQWYLRFWEGRRCEDDERQVRRWMKVAGPTGRFKRALMKKVHQAGGVEGGGLADEDVGRVLRQCLWQWGYELSESEYRRTMEEGQ